MSVELALVNDHAIIKPAYVCVCMHVLGVLLMWNSSKGLKLVLHCILIASITLLFTSRIHTEIDLHIILLFIITVHVELIRV